MKNLLLLFILFITNILCMHPNEKRPVSPTDEIFSFEIKPSITSEFINIETNMPTQSIHIKIIDKAGFIRIEKRLHLERDIDVSELKKGYYLVKAYSGNNMAINRFYKGQDAVNNK